MDPMDELPLRKKYTNLEITLIDYTLSRATLANGEILANAMKDKTIFDQRIEKPGNTQQHNDNQQYDMYRKMRNLVINEFEGKDESQAWLNFVPQTNVLWLYHILSVLMRSADTSNKTNARDGTIKASVSRKRQGKKQLHDCPTITDHTEATEDTKIGRLLEALMEGLDPDQSAGPEWESAKALLGCERYWTDEVREGVHVEDP